MLQSRHMRDYKFRAWDKKKKCWAKNQSWVMDSTGVVQLVEWKEDLPGVDIVWNGKKQEQWFFNSCDWSLTDWANFYCIENYEILQCTGLKDKTGKDIYEGDVVRLRFHEAPDGESFENGVIEWHAPSAAFKWLSGDPSDGNNYWLSQADDQYREVIGNALEHPELLKQT